MIYTDSSEEFCTLLQEQRETLSKSTEEDTPDVSRSFTKDALEVIFYHLQYLQKKDLVKVDYPQLLNAFREYPSAISAVEDLGLVKTIPTLEELREEHKDFGEEISDDEFRPGIGIYQEIVEEREERATDYLKACCVVVDTEPFIISRNFFDKVLENLGTC